MGRRVICTLLLLVVCFPPVLSAIDTIHIDSDRDPRFLPYQFVTIESGTYSDCRKNISSPIHVLRSGTVDGDPALFARGYNPPMNEDASGSIFVKIHRGKVAVENPTFMTMKDFAVFYDSTIGQEAIASGCYMHDSAFVVRFIPFPRQRDTLFLATGQDHTGNGQWEPDISYIATMDYDYDGIKELFFYVNPVRDREPRLLFCLDLRNMKVEWSLPVASGLMRHKLVSCNDSLHPAVIFGTYSPSQGITDQYFDDSYSYLTKVNSAGKIVFHKLTGITFEWTGIIDGKSDSTFYVTHSLPFLDPAEADMALKPEYAISEIDRDGRVIKSAPLDQSVTSIWFFDYKSDGTNDLYLRLRDGNVKIFDTDLNLLAESENSVPGNYLGSVRIAGKKRPVMIFSGSGLTIYSHRFKKLASAGLSGGFGYFEELLHDREGNVAEFVAGGGNSYFIAGITHLNTAQLLNIYVAEYRYYLLGVALTMLVILIAMNIYRAKMKRSLVLITRQKEEIENTHEKLKKAYKELEFASETIAAQREREAAASQYRIASAQFRHEINNALGAVKLFVSNAIRKISASGNKNRFEDRYNRLSGELTGLMERLPELDPETHDRLASALEDMKDLDQKLLSGLEEIVLRGVNRGLSLSEKLRRFERIDYDDLMESVDVNEVIDLALKEYSPYIEQLGIAVKRKRDGDAVLTGSGQLFEIMFRNLLDNSIDAINAADNDLKEIIISTDKPSESTLEVVWQDSGIGIDKEKYEKIFQPFYTEKPETGSGLGLSMVRNIVSKYKGTIEVESIKGKYTKFKLVFNLV